jgi:hypothetical protein
LQTASNLNFNVFAVSGEWFVVMFVSPYDFCPLCWAFALGAAGLPDRLAFARFFVAGLAATAGAVATLRCSGVMPVQRTLAAALLVALTSAGDLRLRGMRTVCG